MTLKIKEQQNGISFDCKVHPRASKNAIKGVREGILQISLNAPPIEGRANEELISFLSDVFGVPKGRIQIIKGHHGRTKSVFVEGITVQTANVSCQRRS